MISKIIDNIQEHRLALVELGYMLREAKSTAIWNEEIGAGVDTWYDFLSLPEIGLSVSEADFLIWLSEFDVLIPNKIQFVPTATMKYLMKHNGDLDDAMVLTTKDFKKKYFEDKHKREAGHKYVVMKILEDGTMNRVYGDELQTATATIANNQITNGI